MCDDEKKRYIVKNITQIFTVQGAPVVLGFNDVFSIRFLNRPSLSLYELSTCVEDDTRHEYVAFIGDKCVHMNKDCPQLTLADGKKCLVTAPVVNYTDRVLYIELERRVDPSKLIYEHVPLLFKNDNDFFAIFEEYDGSDPFLCV